MPTLYEEIDPWRRCFAWWPIKTIGGRRVWLKRLYCQEHHWYAKGVAFSTFEYALCGELT